MERTEPCADEGNRLLNLKDKVVAITGASAGIGLAAARAFSRAGARVALAARRRNRLEVLVDLAVRRFGQLDVMINNGGFGVRGRVEETPAPDFERLIRTNFFGTVYGCQAALKTHARPT